MVYDVVVVVALVAGLAFGAWRGLVLQLGGLLAVVFGLLAGWAAARLALAATDNPAPGRAGVVFVAGYFMASMVVYGIAGSFRKKLEERKAGRLDRALGAVAGLLHAALKVMTLTLALVIVSPSLRAPIKARPTGAVVAKGLRGLAAVLPAEVVDEVKDLIER